MNKIAIDIVLLPLDEVTTLTIRENQRLVNNFGSQIAFNVGKCIPHISLAMGCIKTDDLPAATKTLDTIAGETPTLMLVANGIYVLKAGWSGIEITNTTELQSLHEKVMKGLRTFATYDATPETFIASEDFDPRTPDWMNAYPDHSFRKFFPHITAGFAQGIDRNSDINFPVRFTASLLALCQLGSHCTCRKIVWSKKLK